MRKALQICKGLFCFVTMGFFVALVLFPKEERLTPSGSREPGLPRAHIRRWPQKPGWGASLAEKVVCKGIVHSGEGAWRELGLPLLVGWASWEEATLVLPVCPAHLTA